MNETQTKGAVWFTSIALSVLALSQIGSYLIDINLPIGHSKQLLSWLNFTHVRNMGGIFGIFQGRGWVFAVLSAVVLLGLCIFIFRSDKIRRYEYICYGFIVGGGLSNILDRLIYGSVIDFIDVRGIPFWKYIFNTADVMIHVGVWPLILLSFFDREDDMEEEKAKDSELASEKPAS